MSKDWPLIQAKLPVTDSEADQKLREKYWSGFDQNNNGYLSLA